jgi:hypothetical protein
MNYARTLQLESKGLPKQVLRKGDNDFASKGGEKTLSCEKCTAFNAGEKQTATGLNLLIAKLRTVKISTTFISFNSNTDPQKKEIFLD